MTGSEKRTPTPEERAAINARLKELREGAADLSARLRSLLAQCKAVGLDLVAESVISEIAAWTEVLRRINEEIAQGEIFLNPPAGSAN